MQLTFNERFALMAEMPARDTFERLALRQEILKQIEFTDDEKKACNIRTEQNGISARVVWDDKEENKIKVDLSRQQGDYLRSVFADMNNKKNMPASLIEVYRALII